jgi:2-polyprenyl-3-methyl-5-hydroxy-6-metoxy-1,4-benzoquinol methylase
LSGKNKTLNILDIGWLESTVAVSLASLGHHVTGIDLRAGELTHPNLKSFAGDVCTAKLPKKHFDVIILLSTLEHIGLETVYGSVKKTSDDQAAIDRCWELLKPGGTLLITTPAANALYQNDFMRWYTPARLKALLKKWTRVQYRFFSGDAARQHWQETDAKHLPQPPDFGVALCIARKGHL